MALLYLGIRWLVRYSLRRDTGNSVGDDDSVCDTTHGAYQRRTREMMELREAHLPRGAAPSGTGRADAGTPTIPTPQTRVGA